jgi:prepilin-type N-terminal cleavage/methylation domain-containing protein
MIVGRNARFLRSKDRGLTLMELVMAMTVLAIAIAGYAKTVAMSSIASTTSREATLAAEAGRQMIERMCATVTDPAMGFDEIYVRYNSTAADDPAGVSPGSNFAVAGLDARANDLDGMPGEILFPTMTVGGVLQLREDLVDAKLGMPSDLNGDGVVDALNHAADYQNLPVLVRVRWRGVGGPGQVEFQTVLGDY